MDGEDWRLLGWALERVGSGAWPTPWAAVFEYGRDLPSYKDRNRPEVLLGQAPLALRMVKNGATAGGVRPRR